jgi:hypothetical protein
VVPHIAVYGEEDIKNVLALQKGYKLIALKHWGASNKELAPGQPMRPIQRLNTKTPPELLFFEELCETLKDITLREDEVGFARQAGAIGVTLKDGFQFEKLDPPTVAGLKRAVLDAQSITEHKARTLTPAQPGGTWLLGMDITSLDDWLFRGAVGWKFVWGDLASEILYPMARGDAEGMPLTGANRYTLHFPKSQLPAARYWRISMYDLDGYFIATPPQACRYWQHGGEARHQQRRLSDDLHSTRFAGQRQGNQLAASSRGRLLPHYANVSTRRAYV